MLEEGAVGEETDDGVVSSLVDHRNRLCILLEKQAHATTAYATDADECRVFLSMLGIGPAKLDA